MTRKLVTGEKPLISKTSLGFHRRFRAQLALLSVRPNKSGKHPSAKPLKDERATDSGVFKDHEGDAGRALYIVGFANVVYILHTLQKKSPHGIATRQSDVASVKESFKLAKKDH